MGSGRDNPIKVNLKKLVDNLRKNPKNKKLGVKTIDTDVKNINEKTKLKNTNYGPAVVNQDNEKTVPARVRQQMPTGGDGTAYMGEKMDLKKADMGDVIKDFYKSDAPQFKGRSKEKRREMAIAAKLEADGKSLKEETAIESELLIQDWNKDDIKFTEVEAIDIIKPEPLRPSPSNWREDLDEDWQKENRKDKTDGLSKKAVKAYRRENPGSKLQTAVTKDPKKLKKGSKSAKRRLSFCRRMKGMKKRLTSAKTARDPDSRINKALRRWNC